MHLGESAIALFLLALGAAYVYGIFQIQGREFTSNEIGPAAFPWLLAVLLVGLSLYLLMRSFSGPAAAETEETLEDQEKFEGGGWKILAAASLIVLYVATFESLEFLWATPFFLAFLSTLYGIRRLSWTATVGMAVGFTAGTYLVLWHLFGVLLP